MENEKQKLEELIQKSSNIVFFGGAGVSTESGIPDFRSVDGLYHQQYKYPPEEILSHTFFEEKTEEFYDFYRKKLIVTGARPNAAHLRLAKLEKQGKLRAIITQNIDGLHQLAGSKNVLELHGSTLRNYCTRCHKFYDQAFIANSTGIRVNTMLETLFKVVITKYGTPEAINGTAARTCGFVNAAVRPRTIPHAANAAIGIIRLLPRSEKKFMRRFFFIHFSFLCPDHFNSGHMSPFASIRASRILRACFASLISLFNVNAIRAF